VILALNASPRSNGVTTTLLRAVVEGIDASEPVQWVDVNGLHVHPCLGCLRCRPDRVCVLPRDDGHRIGEMIADATALVIGSPCYWGNMTGPLKTLLDRNVPVFEYLGEGLPKPRQKGKPALLVVASNAPSPWHLLPWQSRGTVRVVKTVLRAGGYRLHRVINVPNARRFEERRSRLEAEARRSGAALTRDL